ncbi:MAG: glycerol-3-phosphate acyltransferase [Ignavibacteria bacterium]|nr:glycerol-3-phosphate acyltransferase [Ignavibacteria bacterium]
MEFLFSILIGIVLGSIPTAYILIKKIKNIDITKNGSGNVGAMNSLRVTGSKLIAVLTFTIDFLKGFLAVYLIRLLFGENFMLEAIGLFSAVVGHCYSFWINFKGGRGLATSGGGAVLLSLPTLIIWGIIWIIVYIYKRNIHFGNFIASAMTLIITFTSSEILNKYSFVPAQTNFEFSFFVSLILLVILFKHYEPIKEYLKIKKV